MKYVVLAGLAVGLAAGCAQDGGMGGMSDDPVAARKATMKGFGGNMKAIGDFVKENKGSAADVAARAKAMVASADKLKGMFPAKTSMEDMAGKTRAKANIWTQAAAFDQAVEIFKVYAGRLAEAAETGNKASIGAAMGALGKSGCGGCHSDFRGPEPKST